MEKIFSFSGFIQNEIGLLGGTFDPIHKGHIYIAQQVAVQLNLGKILLMPTGQPPHKRSEEVTAAVHRWNMAALAAKSDPLLSMCDIEINRKGPSYTVDTLKEIREQYHGRLYFIIGGDSLMNIEGWYQPAEILQLADIVAVYRPDPDGHAELAEKKAALEEKYDAHITLIDCPGIDISSSELRKRISRGEEVGDMLDPAVKDYIMSNGLYR